MTLTMRRNHRRRGCTAGFVPDTRGSNRPGNTPIPGPCSGCAGRGIGCTRGPIRMKRCWRGCGRPAGSICITRRRVRPMKFEPIWADYLKRQGRRHLLWLIVNGVIAPFSALFAILPGPNLIGYWFAYRAIHHSLVVWGIRRVQRNKIPTELHPIAALDLSDRTRWRWQDGSCCAHRHSDRARRARGLAQLIPQGTSRDQDLRHRDAQRLKSRQLSRLTSSETGDHAPTELQHS